MNHSQNPQEDRVLLINKPLGWTSFDVVKKLRGALKIKKIGHAGTLDPLATGLLILCTGKKTKEIAHYQEMEKEYQGTMVVGKTTPSVDLETDFDSEHDFTHLTAEQVITVSKNFLGPIEQVPPAYSAIKIEGQPVYKKARKGETVLLKPRIVEIQELEILSCDFPQVQFRVVCSKGTYIRSLVRDMGAALGVGAYLSQLTRTRIGRYLLTEAYDPNAYIDQHSQAPQ